MIKYVIYKFVFLKSSEGKNFFKEGGESNFDRAQSILESFLHGKSLNIYKTKKDGEVVKYPNNVFRNYKGITVMKVCNVKYITKCKDYKTVRDETNPWCNVVIDNREGVCQIAIEQSGAFDGNSDKVSDLLLETFNRQLSDYGLTIDIMAKMRASSFWDFVDEQCNKNNDTISQVILDFPNPQKVGPVDTTKTMKGKLEALTSLICAVGAVRGSLRLDATKETTLKLDQTQDDLARMVTMCCNNGYNIAVHFRQMGVYRCNDTVKAVYQMNETVTENFINGETVTKEDSKDGGFELTEWLDRIREITKDYEDAKPTAKRRKTKSEEPICEKPAVFAAEPIVQRV